MTQTDPDLMAQLEADMKAVFGELQPATPQPLDPEETAQ